MDGGEDCQNCCFSLICFVDETFYHYCQDYDTSYFTKLPFLFLKDENDENKEDL